MHCQQQHPTSSSWHSIPHTWAAHDRSGLRDLRLQRVQPDPGRGRAEVSTTHSPSLQSTLNSGLRLGDSGSSQAYSGSKEVSNQRPGGCRIPELEQAGREFHAVDPLASILVKLPEAVLRRLEPICPVTVPHLSLSIGAFKLDSLYPVIYPEIQLETRRRIAGSSRPHTPSSSCLRPARLSIPSQVASADPCHDPPSHGPTLAPESRLRSTRSLHCRTHASPHGEHLAVAHPASVPDTA
eukprot:2001201-Rhodomonas_salina.6